MVKLIRIVSEDNANFIANLEAGVPLTENASIALQNLTFENNFSSLKVGVKNRVVNFNLDTNNDQDGIPDQNTPPASQQPNPPFTTGTSYLDSVNYDATNYQDLYTDLQAKLNNTLSVNAALTAVNTQDIYGSFIVDTETDPNRPIIRFKYSPLCLLFNTNQLGEREPKKNELFRVSTDAANTLTLDVDKTNANTRLLNNIAQFATNTATSLLKNYAASFGTTGQWCKGSAFYGCSVYNNVNNAVADDTNGFGIGLSYTDISSYNPNQTFEMKQEWRDYEILIEKSDATYRFISPKVPNTEESPTPAVLPFKFDISADTNQQVHDRIVFQRNNGIIKGVIWTSEASGGSRHELFSYILPDADINKPLYPYLWIKGATATTTIGRPCYTPNTLDINNLESNEQFQISGRQQGIGGSTGDPNNWFEDIEGGAAFDSILPVINNNRMKIPFTLQEATLSLDTSVLKFMGFDIKGQQGEYFFGDADTYMNSKPGLIQKAGICGFNIQGTLDTEFINSDNYVVLLDSNPLQSYDASKFNYGQISANKEPNEMRGRRLNILATIPKNDNSGYLEFVAEVPTFIDLDNKYPQQLKNIRVRVVDKDLNPISTLGTSIITLLVKDE